MLRRAAPDDHILPVSGRVKCPVYITVHKKSLLKNPTFRRILRLELNYSRFDMDSALLAVDFGNGVTKMPSNQIAL